MTGEPLPFSPLIFVAITLAGLPVFWCLVVGIIAAFGWRTLASEFTATSDPPFSASRVYWATMSIGSAVFGPSYSMSMNAWFSETGFWLRPTLLFRPFHPMIHVPWRRVRSVEHQNALIFKRVRVTLDGDMPDLLLSGTLGRAMIRHYRV